MLLSLRTARRLKGLTQDQLAELAGVAQETISAIERRGTKPSWDNAWKIAKALGIEPQELWSVPTMPEQSQEIER